MTLILTIILLICGFIALVQAVNSLSHNPAAFIPVTIILGFLYMLIIGGVWYIYLAFGRNNLVIYGGLAFIVIVMLIMSAKFIIIHRESMKTGYLIAFAGYFLVVLYLTVFSRSLGSDDSIKTEAFSGLERAISEKSLEPMKHELLNLVLFVPFGYLIPNMNSKYLSRFGFAVIGGLAASTVIEGIQMIFAMGQCDINDIIFNSLGAATGYLIFAFLRRVQKNWRIN